MGDDNWFCEENNGAQKSKGYKMKEGHFYI